MDRRCRAARWGRARVLGLAVLRSDDLDVAGRRRRARALEKGVEEREAVGVSPEIGDGVAVGVRVGLVADRCGASGMGHAESFLAGGREALRPGAFRGDEAIHGVVVEGGVEQGAGVVDEAEIGRSVGNA